MAIKSELAKRLDDAIDPIRRLLKAEGFGSRGRTFNRKTEDGIVHVVQVTMTRSDPPGTPEIAGFRHNLYGTFSVGLGVYVPEVAKHLHYWQPTKVAVGEIDCCVRRDLTELWPFGRTGVWPIDGPAELYGDIATYLERYAMPFFERHAERQAMIAELQDGPIYGAGGPPRVVAAIILTELGRVDDARHLLKKQADLTEQPLHRGYLEGLSARLGL
ncbi:DUF4304 domain-containing protein [Devosia sp. Root105]|uniref:DUF4304 domain-containing protein n=1 Tax=Devosia sp. Root105 TaxID=1736423 RepID=UPI0006FFD915|nr:DUF4304 domain-containing protein [Devosia sp. Root105]KQU95641.1 hypothetical protein ASC68_15730 [Devosia sp. Root105]